MALLPGDRVLVSVTIRDRASNTPVDPATVVLTVRDPAGNTTTPTVTNTAVGAYQASVDIPAVNTSAGQWRVRWVSTANGSGIGQGAEEGGFSVDKSAFL